MLRFWQAERAAITATRSQPNFARLTTSFAQLREKTALPNGGLGDEVDIRTAPVE
jgi:hypothetical protein